MTGAWSEGMADEEAVRSRRGRHTRIRLFGMRIDMGVPERRILLPVMEDGPIGIGYGYPRSMGNGHYETRVPFLTLDAFDPASMAEQWDTVLKEGVEAEIVADMGLLEPDPDSIHFLARAGLGSGIPLGFRNGGRRLPISTCGDGMRRLLALRLSFVGAANGVLTGRS